MCIFCDIASGHAWAEIVFEDASSLAFLDIRPLFPGHTLLIPRDHHETLADLPRDLIDDFFTTAQTLTKAVEGATRSQGSFVAINNIVSQSVPHLHAHIVPRNRKDGLRGFFWPRQAYDDADHAERVAQAIRDQMAQLA